MAWGSMGEGVDIESQNPRPIHWRRWGPALGGREGGVELTPTDSLPPSGRFCAVQVQAGWAGVSVLPSLVGTGAELRSLAGEIGSGQADGDDGDFCVERMAGARTH